MVRVTVGNCAACGKELRVKEGAVRPKMRLTCKCGHVTELGQAFSDLKPEELVQMLLQGLQSKDQRISPALCPSEIERLVKCHQEREIEQLRLNINELCKTLGQTDTPGRPTLVWCLGALGESEATGTLIRILHSDSDPEMRQQAIRSLGNIFYQNYIHLFLKRAVESELEIIRLPPGFVGYTLPEKTAYEEYEKAHDIIFVEFDGGDEKIIAAIGETSLQDEEETVRQSAVLTLRSLKHRRARTYFMKACSDSNLAIQEIAEDALSELDQAISSFSLDSTSF